MNRGEVEIINTGCKINLFLRILDKMPNGYHQLETFFLPLAEPHDVLNLRHLPLGSGRGLEFSCSDKYIPTKNNTLTKAYGLYAEATGFAPKLALHLQKNVPHGAGLGGGSANAAGFLLYLQKLAEQTGQAAQARANILSPSELIELAAKVGADVPFFLYARPALATGIGERLEFCDNPFAGWSVLLLCPDIKVSTAFAFKILDAEREEKKLFSENLLTSGAHQANSTFAHGVQMHNDFESVVFKIYPELLRLRQQLLEHGAQFALLSGSGSSLFGLFENAEKAQEAEKNIRTFVPKVFLCTV